VLNGCHAAAAMKVAICRPWHGSPCRRNDACLREIERAEPAWEVLELERSHPNLNLARQMLAETAAREGFDQILWIDSDMTFSVDAARGVVAKAAELGAVVGAAYLEKRRGGKVQADFFDSCELRCYTPDAPLVSVRGVGFGLASHSTAMLEAIAARRSLPWQEILGERVRPFYTPDTTATTTTTDDYVFCRLAIASGFAVYLDPRFRVGHVGEYEFTLEDM
jgi:hypothetical protein